MPKKRTQVLNLEANTCQKKQKKREPLSTFQATHGTRKTRRIAFIGNEFRMLIHHLLISVFVGKKFRSESFPVESLVSALIRSTISLNASVRDPKLEFDLEAADCL
jgi:hypothetical protein